MQEFCMAELSIAEYATRLGLSADTVRGRIRAGQILHRADERGRYVVIVSDDDPMQLHVSLRQDADARVLEREMVPSWWACMRFRPFNQSQRRG
jgi:hypothetical protein